VELASLIVTTYEAARARGEDRCDAFVRAVNLYRAQRPHLPASRAGTEVARILLAAAQSAQDGTRSKSKNIGLPSAREVKYAESA
jgi:hypothetical protein